MTSVRILQAISGLADPANGMATDFNFYPGQVVSIPSALATKWITAGIASATITATVGTSVFMK
jgi:hypothetical protein